jgi:hypothetical protein
LEQAQKKRRGDAYLNDKAPPLLKGREPKGSEKCEGSVNAFFTFQYMQRTLHWSNRGVFVGLSHNRKENAEKLRQEDEVIHNSQQKGKLSTFCLSGWEFTPRGVVKPHPFGVKGVVSHDPLHPKGGRVTRPPLEKLIV